jgi:hypothetical protein
MLCSSDISGEGAFLRQSLRQGSGWENRNRLKFDISEGIIIENALGV